MSNELNEHKDARRDARQKKDRRADGHPDEPLHRMLPQSHDAELGLLGSILLNPHDLIDDVLEKGVAAEHFHIPAHAQIFSLLTAMHGAKMAIDPITLAQQVQDMGMMDEVGGPGFLTHLFTFVPTAAHADHYLNIIREKFVARKMIEISTKAISRAYDGTEEPFAVLEDVQSQFIEIGQFKATEETLRHISEGVAEALEQIDAHYNVVGGVTDLATGLVDFDRMTGGLKPGQVYLIGARPAMGKTALVTNIAEHVACDLKKPVAFFSMEMTYVQLSTRFLCARTPLNLKRVRDGFISDDTMTKLAFQAQEVANAPIYIDTTPGLTTFEFRARARRAVLKKKAELIIIDYVQLMKSTTRRAQFDRTQEISEVSSCIREVAKELGVPILAVAQLSRETEKRAGKRPILSDLRDSGQLEQDAYLVAFPFRPAYYARKQAEEQGGRGGDEEATPFDDEPTPVENELETAELIIDKHRDGPVGTVELIFQPEFARFRNKTEKMFSNNPDEQQKKYKGKGGKR